MTASKVYLTVPEGIDARKVAGPADSIIRALEARSGVSIGLRGDRVLLMGDAARIEAACGALSFTFDELACGRAVSPEDVSRAYDAIAGRAVDPRSVASDVILTFKGRAVRPKTAGQKAYIDAIRQNTVTFGIGPAGTGKTYLAMALAVAALDRREVGRIVLTRPVVEAGENLGFLPGTLEEKIDPYVRPLFDALFGMMEAERAEKFLEQGAIEVAPLAYMRGRTLSDAYVILDEAQNTTPEQMKMFLTRLGFNTKMIITGDASQRDLSVKRGGLTDIERILGGVDDVAFVHLDNTDVVRHSLVAKIVSAYEEFDECWAERSDRVRSDR